MPELDSSMKRCLSVFKLETTSEETGEIHGNMGSWEQQNFSNSLPSLNIFTSRKRCFENSIAI